MKHNFMNKRNGKVASVLVMYLDDDGHMQTDSYDKVEDLLEDYAAYEQAKPEPLIKDEEIRKAVRYWLKCNSGFSAKVICKNNSTTFISEYGEILTFDHAIDFNDARMYGEWCNRSFSIQALCGKEEE